jgi:hypothetical protein
LVKRIHTALTPSAERPLMAQMVGRHHLVAAPQLIAIVDPSHI